MRSSRLAAFVFASVLALTAGPSFAVELPGSVAPGQVDKRFQQEPTLPFAPEGLQLPTPSDVEPSAEEKERLSKETFVLKNVIIEGSSIYSEATLKAVYADKLGQTISLLDAQDIAAKITAMYRNDGYILSKAVVVPQDITDGTLKIKIIEGIIGSISIQGDMRGENEEKIIESYGAKMKALRPARVQDLERYLLLINDLPGVTVSGLLRPAPDQFGAAEMVLSLKNKDYDASYTFDNRGSKYLGPWQHTVMGATNSTLGYYDRTQGRFYFVNPATDELLGGDFRYERQVDSEGTTLSVLFSHSHNNPRDALKDLDVNGNSNEIEMRVTHPFIRQRKENLLARGALDYYDASVNVFGDQAFTRDRLRIARLGGTYNVIDRARGNNVVDMQVSEGMNIFSATQSDEPRSNAVGDSSFTKINMDVSRLQALPEKFSLLIAGSGQYAFNPLLVSEQFGLGGSEYARAFDSASSLGDHGIAGKAELRYTDPLGLSYMNQYQLYSFYDIGRVWVRDGAVGANDKTLRSSTGAGVRLTFTENFSGTLEAAVPLVAPMDEQTRYRHDPRLFVSMTARF